LIRRLFYKKLTLAYTRCNFDNKNPCYEENSIYRSFVIIFILSSSENVLFRNILHRLAIFLLLTLVGANISAQEISNKNPKLFESWILFRDHPGRLKGLLYEIKDSSVIYADTKSRLDIQAGNFRQKIISAKNIDVLKIRRVGSIKRGAWIGGSMLGLGFLIVGISNKEDLGEFASLIIPEVTIIGAAAGAGAGAVVGSFRDIILLKGSLENFNSNRSRLQGYSYLNEYPVAVKLSAMEHKSYIGIVLGPSFPLGDFADKSSDNPDAGFAKTGDFGSVINVGYRITKDMGISVSLFDNQYDVDKENTKDWWNVGGEMIGPMYTIPVCKRLFFDIKPRIGYVEAQLQRDKELIDDGRGFAINLNASLQYNIAKRISILVEPGYLTSRLRFTSREKERISTFDIGFGAAYRFR
jgi:hypothetical protein